MASSSTLAARNKNPLNLRPLPSGQKWNGQIGVDTNGVTGSFVRFESNEYGIRAAVINMRSYVQHAGAKTLRDVIYRWAPPPKNYNPNASGSTSGGEDQNHAAAYLASVAAFANTNRNFDMTPLVQRQQDPQWLHTFMLILLGMNRVEAGGQTVNQDQVEAGIAMALNLPRGYMRQDNGNIIRENMRESETLRINSGGQLMNAVGTVTGAGSAFAMINDWRVAAIMAGVILVVGASVAYYFLKLRKDRIDMNESDIA